MFKKARNDTIDWFRKPHPATAPSIVEPKVTLDLDMKRRVEDYKEALRGRRVLKPDLMTRYHDAAERAEEYLKEKNAGPGEAFRYDKVWKVASGPNGSKRSSRTTFGRR